MIKDSLSNIYDDVVVQDSPTIERPKLMTSPKTERIFARFRENGLYEGFESAQDIAESNSLIHFEGKPIRKIIDSDKVYFSVIDVLRAIDFWQNSSDFTKHMMDFDAIRRQNKVLNERIRTLKWSPQPTARFPFTVKCLDTEGVFFMLDQLKTDQTEAFKTWFSLISSEFTID